MTNRTPLTTVPLVFALLSGLPAQDDVPATTGSSDGRALPGLAAIVGEEAISFSELEKHVDAELRAQGDRLPPAARVAFRAQMRVVMLDYLIRRSLLEQEAKRQELTVTEPEIVFKINEQIEQHRRDGVDLRDEEGLYTFLLESQNLDRKEYRDQIRKAVLVEKLLWKEVYDRPDFTSPQERREFYRRNKQLFQTPSELEFRQIFLERAESTFDLVEIINRELDKGRDFGELATKFSHGLRANGGLWVKRIDEIQSWPRRVRERLKTMKEAEVVRALESSKGIHYLKMEKITMGDTQSFEDPEVQQRIDSIIRKQRRDARREAFVDRVKARSVVKNFLIMSKPASTSGSDEAAEEEESTASPSPAPGKVQDFSPDQSKPKTKPQSTPKPQSKPDSKSARDE